MHSHVGGPDGHVHGAVAHGHSHGDGGHAHPRYADRPHGGHVMLDIGGDVGALFIYADADTVGLEIEISHAGDDYLRSHKEVLERTLGPGCFVAVFDCVSDGEYTLWTDGIARARGVRVVGGEIAQRDWRTAAGGIPPAALS
jgi:hypothetical protein